jgi:E1A/CREB-binding protein
VNVSGTSQPGLGGDAGAAVPATAAAASGPAASVSTTPSPAPADMQRAYEALGLPPPSQGANAIPSAAVGIRPQLPMQGNAVGLGGVLNTNGPTSNLPMGLSQQQAQHLNNRMATINSGLPAALQGQPGSLGPPQDMIAAPNKPVKEWHQSVTQDLRNHLVHKL